MISPRPRPIPAASIFAAAAVALGLASGAGVASAQNVFNPYVPYNSQFYSYIVPSIPDNLAVPGAARGAMEYNSPSGGPVSRYNSFDRWAQEYDAEIAGRRFPVPAAEATRARPDPTTDRSYVREADRRFQTLEDERTREYYDIETQRSTSTMPRRCGRPTRPARPPISRSSPGPA